MVNLDEIGKAVLEGDSDAALKLTKKALAAVIPPDAILNKGIKWGQQKVGGIAIPKGLILAPASPPVLEVRKEAPIEGIS